MSEDTRQTSAVGDSHARLAAITQATDAVIDAVTDIEALLGIVAEQISRPTVDFCALVLLSPDGRTIEPVAAYHPDPRVMEDARHLFFFSSRRRHTRFDCDWSSDVCSSD